MTKVSAALGLSMALAAPALGGAAAAAKAPAKHPAPASTASSTPVSPPAAASATAPTPLPSGNGPDPVAIVGATIYTMDGPALQNGTVIFRGGRIVDVGVGVEIPGRAVRIDGTGKIVTPGLVDASTNLGLDEIDAVTPTLDFASSDPNPIHGAFRVVDGLNPASTVIPVQRMEGVTSAVVQPEGGLISGQGAWIHLDGARVESMVLDSPIALFGVLGEEAKPHGGSTRAGVLRRLREAFDDARFLRTRESMQDENRLRPLIASRLDLEALWPVIDRKEPLVLRAERASDIETALRFARDQHVRLVIAGGAEAWEVAGDLAAANVPVILKAMTDLPSSFESLGARFDNAAKLDAAGVDVVITSEDTHNARTVRQEAGLAASFGLPKDKALAAITKTPAEVFGLSSRVGSITRGKNADLVLWSGDPLELSTQPLAVWIDGRAIPLRSRQTALFDKYRHLPPH